ncbi:asparagine--tRNA ligase [Longicatena sp. 210702-DFI.1.36]|nr:asparagine--tRNA ligase [Eubacterium sp.]MCB5395682.1 asparagine--tRNA ligase [Longicatena caecimuris]MCB6266535.1 asparagine--tRNA ligase [Longicatena sp. 210702-DFI.1.160]MCB6317112.1 asparagine--tRNA ligase [Longicatena sp. 210702-DFI.1.100]MCB6431006.1 asparagine--tRNA ligase [Longicatena sp. 210702-DFI.1.36]MCB6434037.1 asparagine--tRNA ligase [Longicatena sp. 210702-DFI.1.249]MCB6440545.1 asparagine--tRNA ligase [Longicatena sp. 210702-DFI.1.255]MCB6457064.1 asparagine--tRNA ligase 
MTIRELYEIVLSASHVELDSLEYVQLQGWIRTNRCSGKLGFIELNDGTYFRNAQLVYMQELKNFAEVEKYPTGAAITVTGKLKLTPDGKQPFEIVVTEAVLEGDCDRDYPLQKKRHSFEYMREIPHLRPRANSFYAIFRLRSVLSMAIHEFFQNQGFVYVHTPVITGNDAEGAGETFTVTTREDQKYEEDFFGKHASLTVSGQLHVESFAMAFRDVYTFGPTFRAENSNTTRHASEFWMIEPEIAFADLEDDMDLIEDMVKYCIDYVLENAPEEMKFFNSMIDKECIERITKVRNSEFKRMTYTEAIELLKKADVKFENNKIEWGMDLQSEHERYLCEKVVNGPVFLIDYPKDIKAFYMRVNEDNKTVAACDLLVPGVGELVGGSQREERYDVLEARMKEMGMETDSLQWYMDLRRYGGCKHAGFGLGFDRMLMYLTGMQNIRDVEPFPRTPRNLIF